VNVGPYGLKLRIIGTKQFFAPDPDALKRSEQEIRESADAERCGGRESRSAEHGDGAIVRCHHDSNSPTHLGSNGHPDAVGRPPLAMFLCWCARKHGRHTFRLMLKAKISTTRCLGFPIGAEGVRFIDQEPGPLASVLPSTVLAPVRR